MAINILLAEDDHDVWELVRFMLDNSGYHLICVDNGEAALKAVAEHNPQVVLLNYLLPAAPGSPPLGNGLKLLQAIRLQAHQTKVIMLTRSREVEIAFQAGRRGAFAYVTKPFDVELVEVLASATEDQKSWGQDTRLPTLLSDSEPMTLLRQNERESIMRMLQETDWNKMEAARRLGIGRQTLYNKLEVYGIKR